MKVFAITIIFFLLFIFVGLAQTNPILKKGGHLIFLSDLKKIDTLCIDTCFYVKKIKIQNVGKDTLFLENVIVSDGASTPLRCPKKLAPSETGEILITMVGRERDLNRAIERSAHIQTSETLNQFYYKFYLVSNKPLINKISTDSLSKPIKNPIEIKFESYDGSKKDFNKTENGSIQKWYYKNGTLALSRDIITAPSKNPNGYLNTYIETYYYSDGKKAQIITGYNWQTTHYETTNCCHVLTHKQWDNKGNLIYEKK